MDSPAFLELGQRPGSSDRPPPRLFRQVQQQPEVVVRRRWTLQLFLNSAPTSRKFGPSSSSPLPAGSTAARGGRPSPMDSPAFLELGQRPGCSDRPPPRLFRQVQQQPEVVVRLRWTLQLFLNSANVPDVRTVLLLASSGRFSSSPRWSSVAFFPERDHQNYRESSLLDTSPLQSKHINGHSEHGTRTRTG
ncbi:uncharacterized protein LOC128092374 [Culex pipiens pallens]|uniref:uncharacterized protein LOC128092374 n=1 Tax=Culex pipiens pallens TaxID=42434 RepID=UPI0022AA08D3|nr:uncharacterized protein LOC128092374 [Culex pipiens pallens]